MSNSPADPNLLTVGEVAKLAYVSVRTLHHYDDIGLLEPARRTDAGYRLYGPVELARLHEVLLFRELGLSLDVIADLLDQPAADRARALLTHRRALEQRRRRTDAVLRALDRAIEALEQGEAMSEQQLFDGFEDFDHARYDEEAEARWGGTDAYRESQRRRASYDKRDWAAMKLEADEIMQRFAELLWAGTDAAGETATALAEEHRRHIDRWFYPCPPAMHAGLADMYESDARFGEYFEKRAEGLTEYVAAAIRANAAG